MNITDIEVSIVREAQATTHGDAPLGDVTDNRQQAALITVRTDAGLAGYGEANANPAAIKALIESEYTLPGGWDDGIKDLLIGEDPSDPRALWTKLVGSTFWSCKTGLGHVALAGIDMALWDLAGKIRGVPVWQLLGDRRNLELRPYVTLYHGSSGFDETVRRMLDTVDRIVEEGYQAAKVEALEDNTADNREAVRLVEGVREHVGDDFTLLLDVGYRWESFEEARECARELDAFGLAFLETPFPPENVEAYRRLSEHIITPLAGADILTAYYDYLHLLDSDTIEVFQAGACRTGISDMDHLARAAARRGRQFVPWGWCATAFTTAANLHLSVVHDNVPLMEYAPPSIYPEAVLRARLAGPEPRVSHGLFETPFEPGLGIELDENALATFCVE
ncbi:MAG: mandelate racemase/muconate lactonizing enzyme family protein [Actinomycetota bacterium]|nr:mandelate racemase/muconate lactonizing enzyme family protein [Actinomycetota bacterium]